MTSLALVPCCQMFGLEVLDVTACNSIADSMLEFLYRVFHAPPGCSDDAFPLTPQLPRHAQNVASVLWQHRSRAANHLRIKNYYNEWLEDWLANQRLLKLYKPEVN